MIANHWTVHLTNEQQTSILKVKTLGNFFGVSL
jgi:hypothetical protein